MQSDITFVVDRCVYCLRSDAPRTTIEHYLPERLGHGHPFWLPVGWVCNRCQEWAGQGNSIDRTLVQEDAAIRLALQIGAVRGREKKLKLLTAATKDNVFDPKAGTMTWLKDIRLGDIDKRRKLHSRALHKVAIGAYAHRFGPGAVLAPEVRDAIDYMREGGGPGWFRSVYRAFGRWVNKDVGLAVDYETRDPTSFTMVLQLHAVTYWVSLGGRRALKPALLGDIPGVTVIMQNPAVDLHRIPRTMIVADDAGHLNVCRRVPPEQFPPTDAPLQTVNLLGPLWRTRDGG